MITPHPPSSSQDKDRARWPRITALSVQGRVLPVPLMPLRARIGLAHGLLHVIYLAGIFLFSHTLSAPPVATRVIQVIFPLSTTVSDLQHVEPPPLGLLSKSPVFDTWPSSSGKDRPALCLNGTDMPPVSSLLHAGQRLFSDSHQNGVLPFESKTRSPPVRSECASVRCPVLTRGPTECVPPGHF